MAGTVTFYGRGGEIISQVQFEPGLMLDDHALRDADLVVSSVDGVDLLLKYRYGPLDTPVADALARLRNA